ncbi:hypothetical protein [Comamonas testosteroni]|uniref:hypothetical protein n=1 Tax=Comamonas testosteroni TaxID=285 RepID=UPI0005B40748|nr:hypothetical protein [Comamonas testosteroni]
MGNKTHIGCDGKPHCSQRMSMHMLGRRKRSKTVTAEQFKALPQAEQCQKCAKSVELKMETTSQGN